MRFFLLVILLGFPLLELWLMIELFQAYGWAFFCYLVLVGFLGFRLLKDEKIMMLGRMAQTIQAGQTPMKALLSSFKNMAAGVLLIIPGVVTDAIAVILLLIPSVKTPNTGKHQTHNASTPAANDDVIEGEFTRED